MDAPVETINSQANTAVLTLDKVEPGLIYSYQVELNGEIVTSPAKFTSPANYHGRPAPDFKVAVGGALRNRRGFEPPYQILGDGYSIFSAIAETQPNLMIWAGNTAHLHLMTGLRKAATSNDTPWLAPYPISSHPTKHSPLRDLGRAGLWRTQRRDDQRLS